MVPDTVHSRQGNLNNNCATCYVANMKQAKESLMKLCQTTFQTNLNTNLCHMFN